FLIPAERPPGARPEKGIAGRVLTEGGLLVITWAHGERLPDSGFRSDRAAEHPAWAGAVDPPAPARAREVRPREVPAQAVRAQEEGAR
ncbi:PH-like domain-containing protein, partial [Streptomyces sp. 6N223]|uniref:PH-like domain-containing protein n=1 Tax=Streptomyces sp. 6N223 TaxID=3457412 RepID=UPI003FD30C8A